MEFRDHFDRLIDESMERLAHTDGKEEEGGREGGGLRLALGKTRIWSCEY